MKYKTYNTKIRSRRLLIFIIKLAQPITEVSVAFLALSVQRLENLTKLPDNQSFFCLLFFSKKSRSVFFICVCEAAFGGFAIAGIHILACAIHSFYDVIKRDLA